MKRANTKPITLALPVDVIESLKSEAWLLSQGGSDPVTYTRLIRELLSAHVGRNDGTRYEPFSDKETRVIDTEGETR